MKILCRDHVSVESMSSDFDVNYIFLFSHLVIVYVHVN